MKRLKFSILLAFILLIFTEGALRLWVSYYTGVPVLYTHRLVSKYYPELEQLHELSSSEEQINILMLGASVLEDKRGNIRSKLQDYLKARTNKSISIYNLSLPAHSSLDSRAKMELMGTKEFDLVVFYQSINELRANCCPPGVFRADYSHYRWYKEINLLRRHPFPWTVIPYCLDFVKMLFVGEGIKPGNLREDWSIHCGDYKTIGPYRENIEAIAAMSENLLLINYVIHIPENYHASKLDSFYTHTEFRSVPVEMFGDPSVLAAGIKTHNKVLEEVVESNGSCHGLAMDRLLTRSKANFNDVCHLTDQGAIEFVSYLGPRVVELLKDL